jgi:hypothetical protein
MSIEAVAWALNSADLVDATEVLVLIGIANHADKSGRGAYAGQATLAHYARCSDRTVRRKLAALEERGLIRRGDQDAASHIPPAVRPVVWDLVWPGQNDRAGHFDRSGADAAVSGLAGHGSVLSGRSRMSGKPSEEPSVKPSELKDLSGGPDFADFYAVYPRHEKRAEALKAWEKAVAAGVDPAAIIAGARRYAADPNRDPAFTAHASSWLNGSRWDDDPLPARGPRDRGGEILAAEFEAARAADAARAGGQPALPGRGW